MLSSLYSSYYSRKHLKNVMKYELGNESSHKKDDMDDSLNLSRVGLSICRGARSRDGQEARFGKCLTFFGTTLYMWMAQDHTALH